jgi:hypothetical protein
MYLKNEIIESIKKQFKMLSKSELADAIQAVSESINSPDIIRLPLENNGIKAICAADIIYLDERKKKNVFIITKDGEYAYNNQSCNIFEFLEQNHENFRYINTTQIINLDQMKTYDSYLNRVYYTDSDKIYLNCTGASVNKRGFIKVHLGTENDRHIKEVFPRREYASRR